MSAGLELTHRLSSQASTLSLDVWELCFEAEGFRTRRQNVAGRKSLILRLSWGDFRAWGEASPLPGYAGATDNIESAFASLQAALRANWLEQVETLLQPWSPLQSGTLESSHAAAQTAAPRQLNKPSLATFEALLALHAHLAGSPALQTGCEMAWSALLAQLSGGRRVDFFAHYLRATPDQELPLNPSRKRSSLLSLIRPAAESTTGKNAEASEASSKAEHLSFQEQIVRAARAEQAAGVSALKLKCGRDGEFELSCLEALRAALPSIELRLDFNGALPPSPPLEEWVRRLNALSLQWVEDPGVELPGVPLALDECLVNGLPSIETAAEADYLIAKPMVLGGIRALKELCCVQGKAKICLSHLFDGPLALAYYHELHAALPGAVDPPGLGSHAGLYPLDLLSDEFDAQKQRVLCTKQSTTR